MNSTPSPILRRGWRYRFWVNTHSLRIEKWLLRSKLFIPSTSQVHWPIMASCCGEFPQSLSKAKTFLKLISGSPYKDFDEPLVLIYTPWWPMLGFWGAMKIIFPTKPFATSGKTLNFQVSFARHLHFTVLFLLQNQQKRENYWVEFPCSIHHKNLLF